MFCHKCGSQSLESSAFCQKCGAKLILDTATQQIPITPTPQPAVPVSAPQSPYSQTPQVSTTAEPKKKTLKLIFGIAGIALLVVVAIVIAFSIENGNGDDDYALASPPYSDPAVDAVKYGALEFYPSKTLDNALAGFIGDIEWKSLVADDGYTYVNVTGDVLYQNESATVLVQYRLYDDDTFEFYAIEIDGEACPYSLYHELIVKTYESEIISIVKNGALNSHSDTLLGDAFGAFFEDISWEAMVAEDYGIYVNVGGTLLYGNEESYAIVQYEVDVIETTFVISAFEIDGVGQGMDMYNELIDLVMGE